MTHLDARQSLIDSLDAGGRGFIYFDAKLGGELNIPPTAQSPEFSFDVTVIEVELNEGEPHIGRFGVIEIQTMDFHESYRHVVQNAEARACKRAFTATAALTAARLSARPQPRFASCCGGAACRKDFPMNRLRLLTISSALALTAFAGGNAVHAATPPARLAPAGKVAESSLQPTIVVSASQLLSKDERLSAPIAVHVRTPGPKISRVATANPAATREPRRDSYLNAVQVYPWSDGAIYRLYTAPERVSEIALQPGETLISVAAGEHRPLGHRRHDQRLRRGSADAYPRQALRRRLEDQPRHHDRPSALSRRGREQCPGRHGGHHLDLPSG